MELGIHSLFPSLVLNNPTDDDKKIQARERVAALCKKYPLYWNGAYQ